LKRKVENCRNLRTETLANTNRKCLVDFGENGNSRFLACPKSVKPSLYEKEGDGFTISLGNRSKSYLGFGKK
jgi:hypothetical protein